MTTTPSSEDSDAARPPFKCQSCGIADPPRNQHCEHCGWMLSLNPTPNAHRIGSMVASAVLAGVLGTGAASVIGRDGPEVSRLVPRRLSYLRLRLRRCLARWTQSGPAPHPSSQASKQQNSSTGTPRPAGMMLR